MTLNGIILVALAFTIDDDATSITLFASGIFLIGCAHIADAIREYKA